MHELAIMESVLEIVLEFGTKNRAKEIRQINLVTGSLSGIIPRWGELFFTMIAKGTIAENAKLSFQVNPAVVTCRDCFGDTEFTCESMPTRCDICGSENIYLKAGKSFHIDSIEAMIEEVEPNGTG